MKCSVIQNPSVSSLHCWYSDKKNYRRYLLLLQEVIVSSSIMRQRSWMSLRVNFCRWIYRSVLEVWVIVCWAKVSFLAGTPWRLRISQLQRGSPVLKETWPRLVRFRKPSSRVPLRKCTSWLKRSSTKWRSQNLFQMNYFICCSILSYHKALSSLTLLCIVILNKRMFSYYRTGSNGKFWVMFIYAIRRAFCTHNKNLLLKISTLILTCLLKG